MALENVAEVGISEIANCFAVVTLAQMISHPSLSSFSGRPRHPDYFFAWHSGNIFRFLETFQLYRNACWRPGQLIELQDKQDFLKFLLFDCWQCTRQPKVLFCTKWLLGKPRGKLKRTKAKRLNLISIVKEKQCCNFANETEETWTSMETFGKHFFENQHQHLWDSNLKGFFRQN